MDSQSKSRSKSSAATTCIKLLLHIFNFIYMIIGICILAIGIWTQIELKDYMELSGLYYANSAYVMVGVGVLILLVAIGGFYCTAKDKIAPLYLYGIFISLLAIVQMAAGIAGGAYAGALDDAFSKGLTESIVNQAKDMDAWNKVQSTLHCCGVNKASDWATMAKAPIPASCYKDGQVPSNHTTMSNNMTTTVITTTTTDPSITTAGTNATTTSEPVTSPNATGDGTTTTHALTTTNATSGSVTTTSSAAAPTPNAPGRRKRAVDDDLYKVGCHEKIVTSVKGYLGVIVGVCIGFVALQIMGAVLACCLAKKTSKNNYEQIY